MPWRPKRHKNFERIVRERREERPDDVTLPRDHRAEVEAERVREYDRQRGSSSARGYDATWRKLRRWFLRKNPVCVECLRKDKRAVPADEVDHITPIRRGGARLDPANLQSLCKRHHAQKTAREQREK